MSQQGATIAGMYHPWRALRDLGEKVRLIWAPLPEDTLGLTDGHSRIWMSPDQSQAQRRCTIAHEVAHIELGHVHGCNPTDEAAADRLAARRLVPMDALLDALRWTEELEELADVLHVDMPMLMARLDGLTDLEKQQIKRLYDEVERTA